MMPSYSSNFIQEKRMLGKPHPAISPLGCKRLFHRLVAKLALRVVKSWTPRLLTPKLGLSIHGRTRMALRSCPMLVFLLPLISQIFFASQAISSLQNSHSLGAETPSKFSTTDPPQALDQPVGALQEQRLRSIEAYKDKIQATEQKIAALQPAVADLKSRLSHELPFVLAYLRGKSGLDTLKLAPDTPKRLLSFQVMYHAYRTKQKALELYTLSLATDQRALTQLVSDYQRSRQILPTMTPETAAPLEVRTDDPSVEVRPTTPPPRPPQSRAQGSAPKPPAANKSSPPGQTQQQKIPGATRKLPPDNKAFMMPTIGPTVITYANPDYAESNHNYGVAIYTDDDDAVVAPVSGRITFAGLFEGFGKTVVLEPSANDENKGAREAYFLSGFKDLAVKPSMVVRQGRPLGTASARQGPGGNRLLPEKGMIYIEKRRDSIALPPQKWLTPEAVARMG